MLERIGCMGVLVRGSAIIAEAASGNWVSGYRAVKYISLGGAGFMFGSKLNGLKTS